MTAQPQRRLFTVDDYYKMLYSGILREDDRVELIEGDIVRMSPIGSPHAAIVNRLIRALSQHLGDRAIVSAQNPVRLDDLSEPEPDLAVLRPRDDFYAAAHPGPEDVLLLVEVGDTSAVYDRETKLPLYAAHGIAELWLVDVQGRAMEVRRDPDPATRGYRQQSRLERDDSVSPQAFPDVRIAVASLVG